MCKLSTVYIYFCLYPINFKRFEQTHKWSSFLQDAVENINNTPSPSLGFSKELNQYLTPSMFQSPRDDYLMDKNVHEENYKLRRKREKKYFKKTTNLKIGDYVYLSFDKRAFDKSYDSQASI